MNSSSTTADPAQMGFDWLMPYRKPLLRTDEAADCLRRSQDFVCTLIEEGRLEAHHTGADREKKRYNITRRSVLIELATSATYDPSHFIGRIEELLESLDASQLSRVIVRATQLRAKI